MLFCIGALMSNPALFELTKPTGGLRHTWFQIITRFLLCFAEDDRPCLDGLCRGVHRINLVHPEGPRLEGRRPETSGAAASSKPRSGTLVVLF